MDRVDEDYLNEILRSTGSGGDVTSEADVKVKDDGTTYEEIMVRGFPSINIKF